MKLERKIYDKDVFYEISNQIYQVINYYRSEYKTNPIAIILSHNLMVGLRYVDFDGLEYNPLSNTHEIFGIECVESPVLVDLEYKVY